MSQMSGFLKILRRPKTVTNRSSDFGDSEDNGLKKTLNIYDLVFLGVGSTLGVGIYILSGQVSKDITGPGIIISFFIAAVISTLAGLCFAEFGANTPTSGSVYSYCYITLGEFVAFMMGWNLITQYIIGTASVVKALSVYLDDVFFNHIIATELRKIYEIDVPYLSQYFDVFAFLICMVFAVALSFGLKESIILNNILTSVNITLVLFFVIIGLTKVNFDFWSIPKAEVPIHFGSGGFLPYGFSGIIKGAGSCFYGFIGFECIATTGGEVVNPEKALPYALIISLFIIFIAYFSIATVLTLLVPYFQQNTAAPLAYAFSFIGYEWATWIINIGSLFGLIAALFGAFFPISRIIYSMADDGLLFKIFNKISKRFGTPVAGTMCTGVLTGLTAALLDVEHLINLNAIGILLAYTFVSACVIILRYSMDISQTDEERQPLTKLSNGELGIHRNNKSYVSEKLIYKYTNNLVTLCILAFCILSVLFSWAITNFYDNIISVIILFLLMTLCIVVIQLQKTHNTKKLTFKMPLVPFIPALSVFLNIFLMVQFDFYTWMRLLFWLIIGVVIYFSYGIFNSNERIHQRTNSVLRS
ncbi:cationic amino acid transporter 2-like isoform X1 [Planococcus citri]|uniref:cationic amino acid transporter 2-like isoform X1 n=2 Tax=Planococcus citri TaxID=170843 RepID=UPI0031F8EB72